MSRKDNDQEFYDQRAADVKADVAKGDIDAAARATAQVLIEEGAQGLGRLTASVKGKKR